VPTEGVPRQLGDQPVILVGVVAAGDDDEVGSDLPFEVLEHLLDRGPHPGEEPVPEALKHDGRLLDVLWERRGGAHCLPLPDTRGGQHHPGDAQREWSRGQVQQGPAAADLDVVGVRPDDENLERPALVAGAAGGGSPGVPRGHCSVLRRSFRFRSSSHAHT
jgi:hypothetical protein